MKHEDIQSLSGNFESFVQKLENGLEFWFARDLQHLLGYSEWRNFLNIISKAKTAVEISGEEIEYHFVDINKMIQMPKSASKDIPDIILTRYACYLIAMNGESSKKEIAFVQQYFAIQTRKLEVIEKRLLDSERSDGKKQKSFKNKSKNPSIFLGRDFFCSTFGTPRLG